MYDVSYTMDLHRYKDYPERDVRDLHLNQDVISRVFDLSPRCSGPRDVSQSRRYTPRGIEHFPPGVRTPGYSQVTPFETPSTPVTTSMSPEFLRMKHIQEQQSLMDNPTVNPISIHELQQRQMEETRHMADQIQARHASKYQHLKYMSPEMLNRTKGHPIAQSVWPIQPESSGSAGSSDVYRQTSYNGSSQQVKRRDLQQQLEQRHQQILSRPNQGGIQSYRGGGSIGVPIGTSLDEAYK